jgi:hypothetical protein
MITYSSHTLSIILCTLQVVVAFVLLISFKSNKNVNIFLLILVSFGALKSFYTGFIQDKSEAYLNNSFYWMGILSFFVIPCGYLYLKTIVTVERKISSKDLIHSIYPIGWALMVFLQAIYVFVPEDTWFQVRKVNIVAYVLFYAIITSLLTKDFYKNRHQDAEKTLHFNQVNSWAFFFFIFFILISVRALIHFNFDIAFGLSEIAFSSIKLVLWLLILIKVLATPEILFGYQKLKKSLADDPELKLDNRIIKLNDDYFLKNQRVEDYFKEKTLECLLILLNNNNEFILISDLDDLFLSKYYVSLPTLKKRRDICLKDINYQLSVLLAVPSETIFIESKEEQDKRIKKIKINPELIKIT